MENYTKGQWKVKGESYGNYISVGTDKQQVCRVNWGKEDTEYDFANAKLIAAAPEMLNTLFRVHNQIVSDWIPQTDEQKEILESVKNAIKKTGTLG